MKGSIDHLNAKIYERTPHVFSKMLQSKCFLYSGTVTMSASYINERSRGQRCYWFLNMVEK